MNPGLHVLATSTTNLEALADGLQVVVCAPLLAAQQAPLHDLLWAVKEQDEGRLNARLRGQASSGAVPREMQEVTRWLACLVATWLSKLERFSSLRGKPAQGHWRMRDGCGAGGANFWKVAWALQLKQGPCSAPSMRNLRFPLSLIAFSNRLMVTCRGPAVRLRAQ